MRVTGSLQIKRGIYQMMTRIIFDDKTEKQKQRSTGLRSEGKTPRETRQNKIKANQMLASYIQELQTEYARGSDRPFLVAIEEWLAKKKQELRQDTYESYMCTYFAHVKPYFEPLNLGLRAVTPKTIAGYMDLKQREGLSADTLLKHRVIFNGVFKQALAYSEIQSNPVAAITVKDKKQDFCGSAYTPATAKKLLTAVRGDPIEPAVYLGLYLGLRRSEVVGLRWGDIDFEQGIVHVRNTVVRYSTVSEQEQTKNQTSRRDLYLPDGLKKYLIERQKILGGDFSENNHICQWPDGRIYEPSYISHRFHKVLERSGLPMIRFHDLRHTAGSMLINEGQSILQVQNFLGHKKASTTLDIYSHIYLEGKKATASKLDELLSG